MANSNGKPILDVLSGTRVDPPPVWLMRQAGRYLDEYQAVRAQAKNFIDFCFSPDLATEVTLQPIRRFRFDAAILFADILLVPIALGRRVWFVTGEGPKLDPFDPADFETLRTDQTDEILGPVYQTVRQVAASLPKETTLIGFAGSPWTVATYMIDGAGSKDKWTPRRLAWEDPDVFDAFLSKITHVTADYLIGQAKAGAEVLKLFDSWAEGLPQPLFERVVIKPTREIIERVRAAGIDVPIIGFPRGAGTLYEAYAHETGITALALDHAVQPQWADRALPKNMPVQGHLDPSALRAGGFALTSEIDRLVEAWSNRPHIFNLGHGITPDVPVPHVEDLLRHLRRNRG